MPRKPKPPTPKKLTRKRDAFGRFLPAPKPTRKPTQKTLVLRDKFGRFVKAKKPSKKKGTPAPVKKRAPKSKPPRTRVIRQGKDGKFRDERGRFVQVEIAEVMENGRKDGRKSDPVRFRDRLSFQDMIDLYGFDDYEEMPEWLSYLDGAP